MWGGNEELVQKHYALINIVVQKKNTERPFDSFVSEVFFVPKQTRVQKY